MQQLTREMYEVLYCYTEGLEPEIGERTGFPVGEVIKTEGFLIQQGLLQISDGGNIEITTEGARALLRGLIKQMGSLPRKPNQS